MSIKKKIVSGLVMGSVILTSLTPSLANASFNAVSINSSSLSGTTAQVAKANGINVENVYILNADELIDGIPGGVLAGENDGAIVFLENGSLSDESLDLIYSAQNVYAIGGERVIPESMLVRFSNYKGRIHGKDRYETAAKIASEIKGNRDIIVTNGKSYADSLAATSLAVRNNKNIILTDTNSIPQATREYLEANKNADILFVGGTSSLSQKVKEDIYKLTNKNINTVDQNTISGNDRFDTSMELLKGFGEFDSVVIANGTDYKDSILASSLGAKIGAPVLLVDNNTISSKIGNLSSINEIYSVSTENISDSYFKNFIRTVLNDENVDLPIKDMYGNTISSISKGVEISGWTTENLNVRISPGVNNSTIGFLDKGVQIQGVEEDGWIRVNFNGKNGYISSEYISDTEIKVEPVEEEKKPIENNNTDNNTNNNSNNNNNSQGLSYSRELVMTATAYSRNEPGLSNFTASGIDLSQNPNVIAVDPSIIPLGTNVYVEGYGYAVAGDTGGAIGGNIIDVHFDSVDQCYQWGRQTVKVYILN